MDQRLMNTIGEKFLCDALFEPGFEFAPGYGLPPLVAREGLGHHRAVMAAMVDCVHRTELIGRVYLPIE
eukprot:4501043-Pyramimonas_sp.AAC.1